MSNLKYLHHVPVSLRAIRMTLVETEITILRSNDSWTIKFEKQGLLSESKLLLAPADGVRHWQAS